MNRQNAFWGVTLHRFFDRFQSIVYHQVPLSQYLYYQFLYFVMSRPNLIRALEESPGFEDEINQLADAAIYSRFDGPYSYDSHPGGVILMRGGFGDIASLYLPKERFVLLSPNQAEVDLIRTNRPDLTAHNIESFYRDNTAAVEALDRQITAIINRNQDDPLFGSADFRQWIKGQIPGAVRVLDAAQTIISDFKIGCVLTISSIVWMDSALNLMARVNRIPSFTLQHGLILERDLFCHIPILATQKLVWGKAVGEWYRQYGFPESRVSVIGSPRFDIIVNREWCGKERLCRMLDIDPANKIAVYATGTDKELIVPIVREGLETIPELFLIMLLHPSESALVDQYQQLVAGYAHCKVVRFGHVNLYDALSGADFFLTHCSTAALEAMFFKLPVITVEPAPPPFSYGDWGASIRVADPAGLNQAARRLISDPLFKQNAVEQYQPFLADFCIPDGSASQRLFRTIDQFCRAGGIA
jgi:glycosyltransferase involved in cell wall biosynthesis